MMNKQLLMLALVVMASGLFAQEVSKRIVVEHFTNTRCGICSNRNPGFYQNLDNHPDVIHLSVHPSRPYPTCELHLDNPSENDGRTNYYGVYGSTPRLVIQGSAISTGTNYGNASIFTDVANETTPVTLELYQVKENDGIQVDVLIRAEADNSIGAANLFLAAAEKVVNYAAPNGENEHRDVFRRTFTGNPMGLVVNIPAVAGEETVSRYTLSADSEWVYEQMFVVAILNDVSTRGVIQANASDPSDNTPLTNVNELEFAQLKLFPNPVQEVLNINLPATIEAAEAQLIDSSGKVVLQQTLRQQDQLNLKNLAAGSYFLEVRANGQLVVEQIVKD